MPYNKLTPEQERVIVHKGTERPFTGEYDDHKEAGTYVCRRCEAPLYESTSKFDSGCGWPSFDDEIPGAIKREVDADGRRTEILCATCGGHLGHVFTGERLTQNNTRHCVNSASLKFVPRFFESNYEKITLAAGDFKTQAPKFYDLEGVIAVRLGYMGGEATFPHHIKVAQGKTGHTEVMEVAYRPDIISLEDLLQHFFELHDYQQGFQPSSPKRSAIFLHKEAQRPVAEAILAQKKAQSEVVQTEIKDKSQLWAAPGQWQQWTARKSSK